MRSGGAINYEVSDWTGLGTGSLEMGGKWIAGYSVRTRSNLPVIMQAIG